MEPERNVIPMPLQDSNRNTAASPTLAAVSPINKSAVNAEDASGGSVDKIRDILFGAQMRDYDRRFNRLEERLLKESSDLREETRQHFDTLESFIKNEFNALSDRLKTENQQRDEMGAEMNTRLQETAKTLERKLMQLDELTAQNQRALRQQMLDQSKALNDELRRKSEELAASIAREAGELRHDKTDRAALADLFTELALRLNNQFHIPGE
jgi:DNA repair exonuclease SbcCD ATPase subunit